MRESKVEAFFKEQVAKFGGMTEKHVSPGHIGVPDQLVTWPGGIMHLCELKAPKKDPRSSQVRDHARRAKFGVTVFVLSTKEAVVNYVLWAKSHSAFTLTFKHFIPPQLEKS